MLINELLEILDEGAPPDVIHKKFFSSIPDADFDRILSLDPSPNKSYYRWIINIYKRDKSMVTDVIKKLLTKFMELKTKPDIYRLSLKDLQDLVNQERTKKRVLWKSDDWRIEIPNSFNDSVDLYGKKTKWCTAGHMNPNLIRSPSDMFRAYFKNNYYKTFVIVNNRSSRELYQLTIDKDGYFEEFQNAKNDIKYNQDRSVMKEPSMALFKNFLSKNPDVKTELQKLGCNFEIKKEEPKD